MSQLQQPFLLNQKLVQGKTNCPSAYNKTITLTLEHLSFLKIKTENSMKAGKIDLA